MATLTSASLQLAFGGSYFDIVKGDSPAGFWPLNEQLSGTGARDFHGTRTGTYVGGVTFGNKGPFPYGGTAVTFNGTTGFISWSDVAAFEFTSAFTAECLFKTTAAAAAIGGLVGKAVSSNGRGWSVTMTATGTIHFRAVTSGDVNVFSVTTSAEYDDGAYHHCVCTWDGTTNANGVKIYIDGTMVTQGTAVAGTPDANAASFIVGARDGGNFFNGTIVGVAVYAAALTSTQVTTHGGALLWTDVTTHVLMGMSWHYGMQSPDPLDRLAGSGTLTFVLDNSASNPAAVLGYWSPGHANCRAGFTIDIPVQVQLVYSGTTYTKFWGRLAVIDPAPGQRLERQTRVIAHDYMHLLSTTDVREIAPQLNKTEVQLLQAVIEALPPSVQPMAFSGIAADTYVYAFDDLGGGKKAADALKRVLLSAWGKAFTKGDGTFRYISRSTGVISAHTLNDDMADLVNAGDRSLVYDHVRVITHPKTVDAAATTVLASHAGTPSVGPAGTTIVIEMPYRNPANDLQKVGGTEMVTPVATTDFVANSQADGLGSNITANVSVSATFYASHVVLTITNTHATLTAYFTLLQVRGKGIYDQAPVVSEDTNVSYPSRSLTVDLPYQNNEATGRTIANVILNNYDSGDDRVTEVSYVGDRSASLMAAAVDSEPATPYTITETVTGLTAVVVTVRSVQLTLGPRLLLRGTFGLSPGVVGS